MTFEEWESNGDKVFHAYLTIAQEFQSGSMEDQFRVIKSIMKESWDARYETLTYKDL